MSIVIKGLSCPESCLECQFRRSSSTEFPWEECYCLFTFENIAFIERKLDSCPIEEVKEVKRASWIKDESKRRGDGEIYDYCCSLCQGGAVEGTYGNLDVLTDYCPHCGAEMEKRIKIEPFEMSDPIYLLSKEEY